MRVVFFKCLTSTCTRSKIFFGILQPAAVYLSSGLLLPPTLRQVVGCIKTHQNQVVRVNQEMLMPDTVAEQDWLLRELAKNVNAAFLDIYHLSDKHDQHVRRTSPNTTDCRHFCQSCPILRTWNSLFIHE